MIKSLDLQAGKKFKIDSIVTFLIDNNYDRTSLIENFGDFSSQGGNITVYPVNNINPLRLDFFGNILESITEYDVKTGKKINKLDQIELFPNRLKLNDESTVVPGDYVVHEDHGIGIFSCIGVKEVDGDRITYIYLTYLNDDMLFLPIEMKGKLSKYLGVGRKKPKLNKLGSGAWERTYKKTYENIIQLARELLSVYAKREIVKRKPWTIDIKWEREIKKSFGYTETPDQKRAIDEIFQDLEKDVPVDRLICGDVGFGKTEVAIRAAAQAVSNDLQVAILVPTTILAEQHYVTFKRRFVNLPVNIEHISRFVDESAQSRIADELQSGKIDILIGTHKLFSKTLKYKNLGLLIIDEEQKFGVKQKELIKKLRTEVNVLSMTATPIPRTLFMALSGIRDLSQISSPPRGRKSIETKISVYNEALIVEAIQKEVFRGGQVYYLHNEVRTIQGVVNKLCRLLPKLRLGVAHGQMGEKSLAQSMADFADCKIDVLVCSTIIENGLDLPNVNTLIVEDAQNFGLSQLYQIRGRIGRSPKQAYSIFLFPPKKITDTASKRLLALSKNTELGSGYNIALSDLEIRGGGNILGREQHGSMEAVGLVLYSKMLKLAVEKLKKNS